MRDKFSMRSMLKKRLFTSMDSESMQKMSEMLFPEQGDDGTVYVGRCHVDDCLDGTSSQKETKKRRDHSTPASPRWSDYQPTTPSYPPPPE